MIIIILLTRPATVRRDFEHVGTLRIIPGSVRVVHFLVYILMVIKKIKTGKKIAL